MNVTPTPGIAAAWSAAKAAPNQQAAQASQPKAGLAPEEVSEPKKAPLASEGQGTRVDVQV
jgi:hypothetical protein